jgi:hypothetical protein
MLTSPTLAVRLFLLFLSSHAHVLNYCFRLFSMTLNKCPLLFHSYQYNDGPFLAFHCSRARERPPAKRSRHRVTAPERGGAIYAASLYRDCRRQLSNNGTDVGVFQAALKNRAVRLKRPPLNNSCEINYEQ